MAQALLQYQFAFLPARWSPEEAVRSDQSHLPSTLELERIADADCTRASIALTRLAFRAAPEEGKKRKSSSFLITESRIRGVISNSFWDTGVIRVVHFELT
jgi:hypothetical protein